MLNGTGQIGKARSIPGGMAIAASSSMVTTLILSGAIAGFLNAGKITWEQAGYWIMGMLFVASFVGGKCAYWAIKRQRLMICMMSGVLYWGLLLCLTALFFGGSFETIWETAAVIGAGCGASALIFRETPIRKRRKRGVAYR